MRRRWSGFDGLINGWYRRSRLWYIVGLNALNLGIFLVGTAMSLDIEGRATGATVANRIATVAIVGGAIVLGFALGLGRLRVTERDLVTLARKGPAHLDPAHAWFQLATLGQRVPKMFLYRIVPLSAAAAFTSCWWLLRCNNPLAMVELAIGYATVVVACTTFSLLAIAVGVRPALRELSIAVPDDFAPGSTSRLGPHMALELLAITYASGVYVSGFVMAPDSGPEGLLRAFGVSAFFAVSLTLLINSLLTTQMLGPVRALTDGVKRVAQSQLDTRVPLLSNDEQGHLAISFNAMVDGLRQRALLHEAFSRYVDPVLARRIIMGDSPVAEAADVTVMFVDLVSFTTYSEHAEPEIVVNTLNTFFDIVVGTVERHGGHANKLLGDGVLAVFGAPEPLALHADAALAAAMEIAGAIHASGPDQLLCGIGINSGRVVMGSMGGGQKLDFTLIGDAVNVAARTEAMTRNTGDAILVTSATMANLSHPISFAEDRGATSVKGRLEPVSLFGISRQAVVTHQ
jgi:class 3 adenylate cyclase